LRSIQRWWSKKAPTSRATACRCDHWSINTEGLMCKYLIMITLPSRVCVWLHFPAVHPAGAAPLGRAAAPGLRGPCALRPPAPFPSPGGGTRERQRPARNQRRCHIGRQWRQRVRRRWHRGRWGQRWWWCQCLPGAGFAGLEGADQAVAAAAAECLGERGGVGRAAQLAPVGVQGRKRRR